MRPARPTPPGRTDGLGVSARTRLVVSVVVGLAAGLGLAAVGTWRVGLLAGWMAAATVFVTWMWLTIGRMDARSTRAHAGREDSGRAVTDASLLVASLASLGAVALLLLGDASIVGGKPAQAAISLVSVVLAWTTVHTMYTTRYARMYYGGAVGGIDFNGTEPPRYTDFAYLSFTIGMTYQVSDTGLRSTEIRATALRQSLLSYVFGTGIIAAMINLVVGLGK
ncbi:DUF1345 domain-containing protein [Cellulomonas sp. WB94]|uniref:DUF1345 domain-containing protein n=1 Tax=Cellulomonas sp. WB94 TaxID=2173174 RepID=UPI000D57E9C2|nr:DUF1345 domain-containing protein [Cellulomonas sp. WB94]PVU83199.1 DUF1345 domain-containing protein [Cellulomonas sp. WB94]